MDKQIRNGLPQECLFINADKEIMRIEYGKAGFTRSKLSTENEAANREIVNSYNERHGITADQVEMMHRGALIGWHELHLSPQERPAVKSGHIFDVEVSGPVVNVETRGPDPFSVLPFSTITLPATPYEIIDALDKARVADKHDICSMEIIGCELDYLSQFIGSKANLYELNHLAKRLASLSQWELDCFGGMVMMDAVRTKYAHIALDRLINMTYSMENCQIAYEAHDDLSLGKFYADNDFISELETLPEGIFRWLDYAAIGKEMREGEGGVFTPQGYVVQNSEIVKTYQSGDAARPEKPDYAILLSVSKGCFNDPKYDNDVCVQLKLPADDAAISHVLNAVDAVSLDECGFHVKDCAAPQLCKLINNELDYCDGDITVVDDFAQQLRGLSQNGHLPVYKAMLEAAPPNLLLTEAIDLARHAVEFRLQRDFPSPLEYAQAELMKHDIPLMDVLLENRSLHNYGKKLMAAHHAVDTDYGILLPPDGMTLEQCLGRLDQHMEMR